MNEDELVDAIYDARKADKADKDLEKKQEVRMERNIALKEQGLVDYPDKPVVTVMPNREKQKANIEQTAYNELQNILSDPDAKDGDKLKAIKLVLEPHYPKTHLEVKAKVEDMTSAQLLEYIGGFNV